MAEFWKRGPQYCTHSTCDRFSTKAHGWLRPHRYWIRAKDLAKDYGIDVKGREWAGRWKPARCHHHPLSEATK